MIINKGIPEHIRNDNEVEFTAKVVRSWLGRIGGRTLYIEPESPWENGYIESGHVISNQLCDLGFNQLC